MLRFPASMIGKAAGAVDAALLKAQFLVGLHLVSESKERNIRSGYAINPGGGSRRRYQDR